MPKNLLVKFLHMNVHGYGRIFHKWYQFVDLNFVSTHGVYTPSLLESVQANSNTLGWIANEQSI